MIKGLYELVNVDRKNSLPGCGPFDNDFCVVYNLLQNEKNPITGKLQAKLVYSGTLTECHNWIDSKLPKAYLEKI